VGPTVRVGLSNHARYAATAASVASRDPTKLKLLRPAPRQAIVSGLAIGELEQDVGVAGLVKRTPACQVATAQLAPDLGERGAHRFVSD